MRCFREFQVEVSRGLLYKLLILHLLHQITFPRNICIKLEMLSCSVTLLLLHITAVFLMKTVQDFLSSSEQLLLQLLLNGLELVHFII